MSNMTKEQERANLDLIITGTSIMVGGKRVDPALVAIEMTPNTTMEARIAELEKSLGEMLDVHEKGCRFVRGCCQNHHDLTGDGNCYVGDAFKLLKQSK